jgi:hypothetical protein
MACLEWTSDAPATADRSMAGDPVSVDCYQPGRESQAPKIQPAASLTAFVFLI